MKLKNNMTENQYTKKEIDLLNEITNERYENLTRVIDDGFRGTHARLDLTNGNVKKNTEWRISAQEAINNFKCVVEEVKKNTEWIHETTGGINTLKWVLGFIGVGVIANLAIAIFKWST